MNNEYTNLTDTELLETYNTLRDELSEYQSNDTLGGEYFEDIMYTKEELELAMNEIESRGL